MTERWKLEDGEMVKQDEQEAGAHAIRGWDVEEPKPDPEIDEELDGMVWRVVSGTEEGS